MAAPTQPAPAPASRLVRKSSMLLCATSHFLSGMNVPGVRSGGWREQSRAGAVRAGVQCAALAKALHDSIWPAALHLPLYNHMLAPRRVPLTAIWKAKAGFRPRNSTAGPSCSTIFNSPAGTDRWAGMRCWRTANICRVKRI